MMLSASFEQNVGSRGEEGESPGTSHHQGNYSFGCVCFGGTSLDDNGWFYRQASEMAQRS